jgi:hypothetical protein
VRNYRRGCDIDLQHSVATGTSDFDCGRTLRLWHWSGNTVRMIPQSRWNIRVPGSLRKRARSLLNFDGKNMKYA